MILAIAIAASVLFLCIPAFALLARSVWQAREAARISRGKNNLIGIGLALHNYHDAIGTFPPGSIVDGEGAARHGWEAMLLPYTEHAGLYEQIDFDKPWDDPHNLRVFQNPLPEFTDPSYTTTHDAQGLPVSHFGANPLVLQPNRGFRIRDITDGLSHTILAGNMAAGERGWGTPFNLRDPSLGINTGPDSLGSPHPGGTLVLFGDGSVRILRNDLPLEKLKAFATPNGNEPFHPEY